MTFAVGAKLLGFNVLAVELEGWQFVACQFGRASQRTTERTECVVCWRVQWGQGVRASMHSLCSMVKTLLSVDSSGAPTHYMEEQLFPGIQSRRHKPRLVVSSVPGDW